MDIRLLGPVEAWVSGRRLDLGPRQQRLILAVLALEAGRPISTDRLIDLLWPDDPPPSARTGVYTRVAGLRTALGEAAAIRNRHGGYVLDVDPETVDAHRFRRLTEEARAADDDSEAVALLRAALALWTGRALSGVVDDPVRRGLCEGLEEARLVATEDRIDAELRSGEAGGLLHELVEFTETHPGRERPVRQLMLALHRSGQTSRALEVARSYREHLAEERGLDPSAEFSELETAILRADPGLLRVAPVPAGPGTPAQLPPVAAGFTGRTGELGELDDLLTTNDRGDSLVVAITGPGGAGKTALAVRWAQRAADHFPDGRLYVDLRGHAAEPALTPGHALTVLLMGLGLDPKRIPADPEPATALYRNTLAGRRLLIVLDNAADPAQVRPLLPPGPDQVAVVTSRDRMSGLVAVDGARRIGLGRLNADEAEELLTRLIPALRTDAAGDLARACGGLPLALRIAAARVADHEGIADYLAELKARPLDGLRVEGDEDRAIATVFEHSYRRLAEPERRLFRLLGLVPGPTFTTGSVVALAADSRTDVEAGLGRLVAAHLIERVGPDRFRFHDLLGHFARLRASQEESADGREAALERLLTWYHIGAEAGRERLFPWSVLRTPVPDPRTNGTGPSFAGTDDALAWFESERDNLTALVAHAAEHGPPHRVWELAGLLAGYLVQSGSYADATRICEVGERTAHRAGEPAARVRMLVGLGASTENSAPDRSLANWRRALELAEATGDPGLIGACLNDLGVVYRRRGDVRTAERHWQRALEYRRDASGPERAGTLNNLGLIAGAHGRFHRAAELFEEAVALYTSNTAPGKRALGLANLGWIEREIGRPAAALAHFEEAQALARSVGRQRTQIQVHEELALLYIDQGRSKDALREATAAVAMADHNRETQFSAYVRAAMARARLMLGQVDRALADARDSLAIARDAGDREPEITALLCLAGIAVATEDPSGARSHAEEARELASDGGYRAYEGRAWTLRSEAELLLGRAGDAAESARTALAIHEDTGQHVEIARAHRALGSALSALSSLGDPEAERHLAEARRMFDAYRM